MNNLGKKIVSLRTTKNITQEELAKRVGVTRQAISKWERGEGLPDLYNIKLLAKSLDVSVDDLIQDDNPEINKGASERNFNSMNITGYFKDLLYKAKTTTDSDLAKKIRKNLLLTGGIGLSLGIVMIVYGFFAFAAGGLNAVNDMGIGSEPYNPIPFMAIFMLGGIVSSISVYILYAGLGIVIAEVASNFLDTRKKCPKCGDEIDHDERCCSNCGYDLDANIDNRCECGRVNLDGDKYCRECGKSLS